MRSFLEMCTGYCCFVPSFDQDAVPLNVRMGGKQLSEFELSTFDLDAFQILKALLMASRILALRIRIQWYTNKVCPIAATADRREAPGRVLK